MGLLWALSASSECTYPFGCQAIGPILCACHVCRNEQHFEQKTGSGYFQVYRSESITYYGQPPGPLLHQQMQPGLQAAGAGWGVLALVFLLGSYLAVVSRLAAVWDRTRYSFCQYEQHRSLSNVACTSACASPPWAVHPHTQSASAFAYAPGNAKELALVFGSIFSDEWDLGCMQVFSGRSRQSDSPMALLGSILKELQTRDQGCSF